MIRLRNIYIFYKTPKIQKKLSWHLFIEQESNKIRNLINNCSSPRESFEIFQLIEDFRASAPDTPQMSATHASLLLELNNKQPFVSEQIQLM